MILYYRRVFGSSANKPIDIALLILLTTMVLWGVAFFVTFVTLCGLHVDYAWGSVARELTCASTTRADEALSTTDVITDLMVMMFPVPLVEESCW